MASSVLFATPNQKVYRSTLLSTPILLKHRFPKQYRHPTLDRQLTRTRVTSEARCLVRAKRAGVCVPGVRCVDETAGVVGMEWIEGWSVREVLGGGEEGDEVGGVDEDNEVVEEGEGEEEKPEAWVGRDLCEFCRLSLRSPCETMREQDQGSTGEQRVLG